MSLIIPISYAVSGFFMKYSDDEYDENLNKKNAIILGILCGIITGFVSSINSDAACIFIAILLGNLIAFKIDGIHHLACLVTFILVFLFLGIPNLTFLPLIIIIIGAFLDEIGNDNKKLYLKSDFFKYFFDYRFTLKIVIFVLAILGVLRFESFIYFLLFEISYEIAGLVFKKLN